MRPLPSDTPETLLLVLFSLTFVIMGNDVTPAMFAAIMASVAGASWRVRPCPKQCLIY